MSVSHFLHCTVSRHLLSVFSTGENRAKELFQLQAIYLEIKTVCEDIRLRVKITTLDVMVLETFLLGRQVLVYAPTAVRLRADGLTCLIKSAVKATG